MRNLICAFQMTVQRCFQLRISQITQQNHCMNALTSKSWIWGAELSDILTTFTYIPSAAYVEKHRKCELHARLIGRVPRHSSPAGMQNPKFGLSCVHCVIQISQLLLSCVHCVIQNAHFELLCRRVKTVKKTLHLTVDARCNLPFRVMVTVGIVYIK